jgi:splicing factor 1
LRAQVNMDLQLISQGSWAEETPPEARSPSPEPVYDAHGARTNTRPLRARARLQARRDELIETLVAMAPGFRPPAGWRPPKRTKKLYVPAKAHPSQNWIGLVLGPMGQQQKEMEAKTGAKIAIRRARPPLLLDLCCVTYVAPTLLVIFVCGLPASSAAVAALVHHGHNSS